MQNAGKWPLTTIMTLVVLVMAGCTGRNEEKIGSAEAPLVLVMSKGTTEGRAASVETLRTTLERESGMHIKIQIPPNPVGAISIFSGMGADAGLLGPFEYLLAREVHGVEAGMRLLRDGPSFKGTILVQADSEITDLSDLQGKRIAYTDPYSMSGFLLPAAKLKKAGIEVDAIYAGNHDGALKMLEEGRVHAAATYLRRAEGELESRSLRIIMETGHVPNEPLFFRKNLPQEQRQKLIGAFKSAVEDAQCQEALLELLGCDGVAVAQDSDYYELEQLVKDAGKHVQSLVPGGWFVQHSALEPLLPTP